MNKILLLVALFLVGCSTTTLVQKEVMPTAPSELLQAPPVLKQIPINKTGTTNGSGTTVKQ